MIITEHAGTRSVFSPGFGLALAIAASVLVARPVEGGDVALNSISPDSQRVYSMVTLRGQGFGLFDPTVCRVLFESADGCWEAGYPYVWRDDFIKIRVPVGGPDGPISLSQLDVSVVTVADQSSTLPFTVMNAVGTALAFTQRSSLMPNGFDSSRFLGDPALNMARTKDADIGDVNGDGFPDLIDNNGNNVFNNTHEVLRINDAGKGFNAMEWEPLSAGDPGTFPVEVPPGGDFVSDSICYDADFVDLNNDELDDWVQAAVSGSRTRVVMNNRGGVPGQFTEATSTWLPQQSPPGNPDDVAHTDVNFDGFIDVAIAFRGSRFADLYINQAGTTFGSTISLAGPMFASVHDVFFIDANDDLFPDAVLTDESSEPTLHQHNGELDKPGFNLVQSFNLSTVSGLAADFNADGVDDMVLVGLSAIRVYLNDPLNPGTFATVSLPDASDLMYDVEAGDVNLDGTVDLVVPSIVTNANGTVRVWLNDGTGNFTNATSPGADVLFPGIAGYQRLSADLIDFDLDGDLDLYLTGADGAGVMGIGQVANQFWENDLLQPAPCLGDINDNGTVDTDDLLALLAAWGSNDATFDFSGNGVVDILDLLMLLAAWGPCE